MVELCWVYCLSCCNIELVCLLKWRVSCCCVGEGLFIIGGSKGSCLKIELQRQSCAVSNCFRWIWCFWMFDAVVDLEDSVYMLVLYMCLPLLGEIIYFNHWRSFFHLIQRIADTKWCRFDQGMKIPRNKPQKCGTLWCSRHIVSVKTLWWMGPTYLPSQRNFLFDIDRSKNW